MFWYSKFSFNPHRFQSTSSNWRCFMFSVYWYFSSLFFWRHRSTRQPGDFSSFRFRFWLKWYEFKGDLQSLSPSLNSPPKNPGKKILIHQFTINSTSSQYTRHVIWHQLLCPAFLSQQTSYDHRRSKEIFIPSQFDMKPFINSTQSTNETSVDQYVRLIGQFLSGSAFKCFDLTPASKQIIASTGGCWRKKPRICESLNSKDSLEDLNCLTLQISDWLRPPTWCDLTPIWQVDIDSRKPSVLNQKILKIYILFSSKNHLIPTSWCYWTPASKWKKNWIQLWQACLKKTFF